MTVKYSKKQLQQLKAAYASGALRVRFADKDITYQNAEDMARAIARIEKELGLSEKKIKLTTVEYSNGL